MVSFYFCLFGALAKINMNNTRAFDKKDNSFVLHINLLFVIYVYMFAICLVVYICAIFVWKNKMSLLSNLKNKLTCIESGGQVFDNIAVIWERDSWSDNFVIWLLKN